MKKKILIPIIAGALVIIGVVLFLVLGSKNESYYNIKIMDSLGTVNIERDGDSFGAYEGLKMRDKDLLKVGSDGFTRIDCDRQTYSHFEHDTEASFIANDDKKLTINLIKGEMVVEVQKKYKYDDTLTIKTPNTTMAIRGTVVAIRTFPSEGGYKTINYCLEGKAEIETGDGEIKTLNAGNGWMTVTNSAGDIMSNRAVGPEDFEFSNIDVDSLKGADGNPIELNYPTMAPGNINIGASDVVIDGNSFPDMIFRLLVMDKYDSNHDGILSVSELSIDKMNVDSQGIEDLKGIEFFTELTYLNCERNNLKTLNLSNNRKLTELYCGKNQLTALNISGCNGLIHLSCSENGLSELETGHLANLKYLACSHNKLTALDVTGAKNLNFLNCSQNSLSRLDISSNPQLEYLDCSTNALNELNTTNNLKLVSLYCYVNNLTMVDVSRNTLLEHLFLGDNLLSDIDVGNNTALLELSCYNNNSITKLDISSNTKLTLLNCSNCSITEIDVSRHPDLEDLVISFNDISTLDVSNNRKLKNLQCIYTELTSLDIRNNPELSVSEILYDSGKTNIIQ